MSDRIIVFRTGQLGDTLVSLPALYAIWSEYPHARVMLITDRSNGKGHVSPLEIFEACGIFSEILTYTPARSGRRKWIEAARLMTAIRRFRADKMFYLAPVPRSSSQLVRDRFFFQRLCGIRDCYGVNSPSPQQGERDEYGQIKRTPSEVDRLLAIVAEAGIAVPPAGQARLSLPIPERCRRSIDGFWERAKVLPGAVVIALGVGSKMPVKRWPLERYVELAKLLVGALPNARLLIVGGQEDREPGQALVEVLPGQVNNWAGQLTILESAEALRRCVLYVGNDTGTMHLAAAVGTRCVALFSARDHPGRWEPYGDDHVVLRKNVPCAGCLLTVCEEREMACLKEVRLEEVFAACLSVLCAF
jgi:ADP-heptose:LPS heptosyltransferase